MTRGDLARPIDPLPDLTVSARLVRALIRCAIMSAVVSSCSAEQGKVSPSIQGGSAGNASAAQSPASTSDTGAARASAAAVVAPATPAGGGGAATSAAPEPAGVSGATVNRTVAQIDVEKEFPVVRALYVNRFAAQSSKRMRQLIQIADETEINALVIDIKDEFGLNYVPSNKEFARNGGRAGVIRGLPAMLDTLRAHKILPIARMVVFKDSVTASVHPEWTIRRQDGSLWRDKKNNAWVNPYHHELWAYNIGVAEELVKMGFGEIQFDYIRFPEPYPSLPKQVFPDSKGTPKPDVLAAFLKEAKGRINKLGARSTADIFGLVTTVSGPLEVGQDWEKLSPNLDVVLPMVYPSHYPRGDLGLAVPNAQPYEVLKISLSRAKQRDKKLGISTPEHVRPWLQAFSLGKPPYGPAELEAQKKGAYDAGYDGWVLWNPGSKFEPFLPALEKGELKSHKK